MPGLSIKYQQGKINIPADLLSRRPDYEADDDAPQLALTTLVSQLESGEITKALARDQLHDPTLQPYREAAEKQCGSEFRMVGGVLHRVCADGSRVVVAPKSWREKFMRLAHDDSGHMGLVKTVHALKQRVWWPALVSSVRSYCQQCPTCARFKVQPVKPGGLLHPLPIPSQPWEDISIDLVTDLPVTKRKHGLILTVVDRFSKMAHFIPLV